jgi:hypothetical protein
MLSRLEVAAADLSYADLKTRASEKLPFKSGEGLWMAPFRGIPETGYASPLDLIYLDEDCRVIEVVESFPTFRVSPSSPRGQRPGAADSTQSIPRRLKWAISWCSARPKRCSAAWSGFPDRRRCRRAKRCSFAGQAALERRSGVVELGDRSREEEGSIPGQQTYEMDLIEPGMKDVKPPKSWLKRWWSPDPRKRPI